MRSDHDRKGTLGISDDGAFRLQFRRHLPYSVTEVWDWVVTPEKLQRWLPGCHIESVVGGKVLFDFGDEGHATGTVTEISAPGPTGRLVHSWQWPGLPDSTVRWTLSPQGDATELLLVHSEVVAEPAVDFAIGWHVVLDALALALADTAPNAAWEHLEAIAALYTE